MSGTALLAHNHQAFTVSTTWSTISHHQCSCLKTHIVVQCIEQQAAAVVVAFVHHHFLHCDASHDRQAHLLYFTSLVNLGRAGSTHKKIRIHRCVTACVRPSQTHMHPTAHTQLAAAGVCDMGPVSQGAGFSQNASQASSSGEEQADS